MCALNYWHPTVLILRILGANLPISVLFDIPIIKMYCEDAMMNKYNQVYL